MQTCYDSWIYLCHGILNRRVEHQPQYNLHKSQWSTQISELSEDILWWNIVKTHKILLQLPSQYLKTVFKNYQKFLIQNIHNLAPTCNKSMSYPRLNSAVRKKMKGGSFKSCSDLLLFFFSSYYPKVLHLKKRAGMFCSSFPLHNLNAASALSSHW